ncbi:class I SAM-dependent methyltransferase [Sulfurimonas sp.]|uniref:class I SAM-dependent methyltransferase n=1 Tax=Sulfurimonas sp. TaxID=2022749 RepID=UPI003D1270B9
MEDTKIKESIKNTFDDVAKSYDTNRHFHISAKKLVELAEVNEPKNILDLSTGTGHIAIELAKKFPNAQIHAVDISDEMLNIARVKAKELGLKNITFYLQDVENLEFEGIEFDLVTCGYGLFFYPNMDDVFCDICKRVKDDGLFIFSTFTDNAFQPYVKIFLDMLQEGYNIAPPDRIEKRQLNSHEEIKQFSSQVSHKGLVVHDVNIRFAMDIDEWWSLIQTTGFSGLLTQLDKNFEQFEKEYFKHLKTLHQDNAIDFNADSLISVVKV